MRIVLSTKRAEASWAASLRDVVLGLYLVYVSAPGLMTLVSPGADPTAMVALNDAQGSLLNQIVVLAALISALAVSVANRTPLGHLWRGVLPLLAFTAIAALSIAWSDYPDLASRRVLRLVAELATLVLLISAYSDPRSLFRVVFRAMAFVALLDIGALALTSSYTPIGYQGVHGHKNEAGSFAFFALPVFMLAAFDRRVARWRPLALVFALAVVAILILSQSKTGAIASVVSAAFVLAIYCLRSDIRWVVIGFALFIVLAIAGFFFFSDLSWNELLTKVTGDPTFTGRQDVWDFMLARIEQSPFIGYGFGSFWGVGQDTDLMLQQANITFYYGQAHNGYLDVAGELGLLGVAAVAIMFLLHAAKILRLFVTRTELPLALFASYVMLGFILYNLTESNLFRPGADLWIYYVVTTQAVIRFAPVRAPRPQYAARRRAKALRATEP